ncbi:unnamed protein product, partial [Mesorhabditis spiculigera]
MAAIAHAHTPIGAPEVLDGAPASMSGMSLGSRNSDGRSPRCEAFLMTGDKILNLTPNISPCYAKLAGEQLPPNSQIAETPRRPLDHEFPSVRRSRIPKRDFGQVASNSKEGSEERTLQVISPLNLVDCQPENSRANEKADGNRELEQGPSTPLETEEKMSFEGVPTRERIDSSMQTSICAMAPTSSHPQLRHKTSSSDTFVIAKGSPTKDSAVTVNAVMNTPRKSVTPITSGCTSPAINRIRTMASGSISSAGRLDHSGNPAATLARHLFCLNGHTTAQVAQQLDLQNDFARVVTEYYFNLLQFQGKRIDAAIREFMSRVELIGETAQRERLLQHFSERYYECNPSLFKSTDDVHALTCALLLLNSDLHNPNNGKKMTAREFVNNIAGTGTSIEPRLLKALYNSIKQKPIIADQPVTTLSRNGTIKKALRLAEVDPESQVEYKSGWLMRKCLYDSEGTRTPFGRRGWRMWYVRLRGLALYFDREEVIKKRSRWETFSNTILLHHAVASEALDYDKKPHCFRLRTANFGEYLFQTSDSVEVANWISEINFVCASLSTKSLPPAVSACSFTKPRLPALPSTASLPDQVKNHENACATLKHQLETVRENAPPINAKGRVVHEFFYRERFLTAEIERYDRYAIILRHKLGPQVLAKLGGGSSDSTSGVHSKSDLADDADKLSYREALQHNGHY